MNKNYRRALSIAGFDGSGGAGMHADLKTFSALGCYGMTVLTSLPVQNTTGVKSIYSIPLTCIQEQLTSIFDDIGTDVIKIGMLHDTALIELISDSLSKHANVPVVLDPVIYAKGGSRLLKKSALDTLKQLLIPFATILTPNIPEASEMIGAPINCKSDMEHAAQSIATLGPPVVIVKGGHAEGFLCSDCIYYNGKIHWLTLERIKTSNTHGTGCTFSAAIASYIANGHSILSAIKKAKLYTYRAIEAGSFYKIGLGHGPLHHFHNFWR